MWCLLVFPGSRCVFASEWLVGLDQILLSTSQMARFCTRLLLNLNLLLICHVKGAPSSQMIILLKICSRFVLWCLRCLLKLRSHLAGNRIRVCSVTKGLEICNIGTINLDVAYFLLFSVLGPILFLRMYNSTSRWIRSLCFWFLCVERVIVRCAGLLPWLVCSITLSVKASMCLLSKSLYEHALRIIFSYFFTFLRKISRCRQLALLPHIIDLLLKFHQLLSETWVRINKVAPLPHNSQRFLKAHSVMQHKVCANARSTTRDTSPAMDENSTATIQRIFDKIGCLHEMATQVLPRHIHNLQHFVLKMIWMGRRQSTESLQNMRDPFWLEAKEILSSPYIA